MNASPPPPPDRSLLWRVLLAGYWLLLVVSTHVPPRTAGLPADQLDKLAHFAAYALLAWLLAMAWESSTGRLNLRHLKFLWLVVVAYGIIDELTQPLMGRTASIADWLADAAGAAVGLILFQATRRAFEAK
jgi:VanZ family protein